MILVDFNKIVIVPADLLGRHAERGQVHALEKRKAGIYARYSSQAREAFFEPSLTAHRDASTAALKPPVTVNSRSTVAAVPLSE